MAINGTIKISLALKEAILNNLPKELEKTIPTLKLAILNSILRGVSPVEGERFPPYSKSYLNAIKKGVHSADSKVVSPVNMKLSGAMLRSLTITRDSSSSGPSLKIAFESELARYHNNELPKKRRLLPTESGEQFNRTIRNIILTSFQEAIEKIVRRMESSSSQGS